MHFHKLKITPLQSQALVNLVHHRTWDLDRGMFHSFEICLWLIYEFCGTCLELKLPLFMPLQS